MINGYHIWNNGREKVRNNGVRGYLNSKKVKPYLAKIRRPRYHLGPVLFDSGGYSFMRKSIFNIKQSDILALQEASKPDIAITLDWPIDPSKLTSHQRWRHLEISLRNAKVALETKTDKEMLLMPVVHGWNEESIRYSIKSLLSIEKEIGEKFGGFSIGSIVPHSFKNMEKAVELILDAKKELPDDRLVHVLGLGGISTIPVALMLGIDMFDSSTWMLSAIDRFYFLPNFKRIMWDELKEITCKCPICKSIKRKEHLLFPRKEPLALHNFFVLENECKMLIKSLRKNTLHETIKKRLGHNKKLIELCEKIRALSEKG